MVWDLKSGYCSRIIKTKHSGGIPALQVSKNQIVVGSADKSASKWTFKNMDE
jgi:hypothetical protein